MKPQQFVRSIFQKLLSQADNQQTREQKGRCQYLGGGEILLSRTNHRLILPGWDLSLTPWIINSGTWEPALTEALEEHCRPGMIALDIGANIGWFSSIMAASGAAVHAFEPNPRLESFLRKNIFLNAGPRTPLCSVNRCVVGSAPGEVQISFPHWLVGGAGIHDSDQSQFLDSLIPEPVKTEMVTIDAFLSGRAIKRVDVIKIDVEGYEEEVIKGALNTISHSTSLLVPLEYTRGRYSREFPTVLHSLFTQIVVLPERRTLSCEDLIGYEQGEFMRERPLLELLCTK
jgi:FkbM family methyltransferase